MSKELINDPGVRILGWILVVPTILFNIAAFQNLQVGHLFGGILFLANFLFFMFGLFFIVGWIISKARKFDRFFVIILCAFVLIILNRVFIVKY